jgi:hypothetical protein
LRGASAGVGKSTRQLPDETVGAAGGDDQRPSMRIVSKISAMLRWLNA